MKQLVFSLLTLLTIAAILQPLILFYLFRGEFLDVLFPSVGLLGTVFLIGIIFWQRKNLPKVFFLWSLVIPFGGLVTLLTPEGWIYTSDGLLLIKERERIVSEIKRNQIQNSIRWQKTWLPVSTFNYINIEVGNGMYRSIRFPTQDKSFLETHVEGVLYSELSEKNIPLETREEAGGVIIESKLTLRKIKPRWYFYTYEQWTISD